MDGPASRILAVDQAMVVDDPAHPSVRAGQVPLIGRATESAQLRTQVAEAFTGRPRAVFLTGETGIGKSRLLREAVSLAVTHDAGTTLLLGRCLDERGMPPYLPWIEACAILTPPARGGHLESTVLLSLLAGDEASPVEVGSLSPEQRKLRLFDRVCQAVAGLASSHPVVLGFDDLQWSDAASNELLRYLLAHVPPVPLLVIGAYRTEEVSTNADLMRTIEELDRRRLLTTVVIGPLPTAACAHLVEELVPGIHLDPRLVTAVLERCEGNPFYAEEVVRALAAEGSLAAAKSGSTDAAGTGDATRLPLPRGVAAIIERRLRDLSDAGRTVLEAAALIGRQIPAALVATVVGIEEEEVGTLLEDATRAALVRPVSIADVDAADMGFPSDFAFLHDRIRETIDAGINPVRRRRLHGRIADALEDAAPVDRLAVLSALTHHRRRAGQPAAAAVAAERLGDAAMLAHAHAEAARAYRTAVNLAPAAGVAREGSRHGQLLLRLGEAALAAGAADGIDAVVAAEAAFRAVGDRRGMARAERRLGAAHARREEFELAVTYLQTAQKRLSGLAREKEAGDIAGLQTETAEVLVELCSIWGLSLGRYDEAEAAGQEALALAGELGATSPALEARARLALANSLIRAGRLAEGAPLLATALTQALAGGDANLAAEAAGALANYHYWVGDINASERLAVRRRELAVRGGDPYALRHAVPWLAFLAAARGDWVATSRLLTEAEELVDRLDSEEPRAFLHKIAGFSLLLQGRYDEAVGELEAAIAGFRPSGPGTLVWYLGCLGTAYLAAGQVAASERIIAEAGGLVEAVPARALPRGPALAELGVVAAMRGDRAAAARWYPQLLPFAGQLHWILTDRVLGMLATVLGELPRAERHFEDAARMATRGGLLPELALTLAEHGRALQLLDVPAAGVTADALLRDALDQLHRLGMASDATRVASLLGGAASPPAGATSLPAGLSAREAEVLRLVVGGLTNREIGTRLGISGKTVTNHLTHIFTKANLDNRAGAVAFALRHGLA